MTDQTLRWRGGWARVGPWRGHHEIAHLTLCAITPPTTDTLTRFMDQLRAEGYTGIVTGALSPGDSLVFVDSGFAVRERLHLLAHDMHELPASTVRSRRARRSDHAAVLALDALAFTDFWDLDERALFDTLHATPATRFRVVEDGGDVAAYAICGRAGTHGYLQRVAVRPESWRLGYARGLVGDALHWLARHGITRTLVNTQHDNVGALRLYDACGFQRLPVGLCVFGRSL